MYGREGSLTLTAGGSVNIGPSRLFGARGKESLAALDVPERFTLVPEETPAGPPRNVAQAYTRLADARSEGAAWGPDFGVAVQRHRLLDAFERSSNEGRAVRLSPSFTVTVSW